MLAAQPRRVAPAHVPRRLRDRSVRCHRARALDGGDSRRRASSAATEPRRCRPLSRDLVRLEGRSGSTSPSRGEARRTIAAACGLHTAAASCSSRRRRSSTRSRSPPWPRTLLDLAALLPGQDLHRAYERAERLRDPRRRAQSPSSSTAANGHRGTTAASQPSWPTTQRLAAQRRIASSSASSSTCCAPTGSRCPGSTCSSTDFWSTRFWPEANLVVELDGYEFHRDRDAFERDRAQDRDPAPRPPRGGASSPTGRSPASPNGLSLPSAGCSPAGDPPSALRLDLEALLRRLSGRRCPPGRWRGPEAGGDRCRGA